MIHFDRDNQVVRQETPKEMQGDRCNHLRVQGVRARGQGHGASGALPSLGYSVGVMVRVGLLHAQG